MRASVHRDGHENRPAYYTMIDFCYPEVVELSRMRPRNYSGLKRKLINILLFCHVADSSVAPAEAVIIYEHKPVPLGYKGCRLKSGVQE